MSSMPAHHIPTWGLSPCESRGWCNCPKPKPADPTHGLAWALALITGAATLLAYGLLALPHMMGWW